jgi:hypothetical protein
MSEYERRGKVEVSLREAEEQQYLDDCRQCTREPLQNAFNTLRPVGTAVPSPVVRTHRLEAQSDKFVDYSLTFVKEHDTPACRVKLWFSV